MASFTIFLCYLPVCNPGIDVKSETNIAVSEWGLRCSTGTDILKRLVNL